MDTSNMWILALIGVAVGLVIGYLLGRGGTAKQQKVSRELEATRAELDRYKQEVTTHFETTAELVNGLTEQYRQVHQHLASGAQTLCSDTHPGESLQASLQPRLEQSAIPTVTDSVPSDDSAAVAPTEPEAEPEPDLTPPRDYAPKAPDEDGMLSDRYSARHDTPEEEPEPVPPADPATPGDEAVVAEPRETPSPRS